MEGQAEEQDPQLTEEEESDLIQGAIDKIGEDMREYLSGSIQNIHDAAEVFREQYPGSKNNPKYTEENVTALIRKSLNDGLAELGIRCGPYDTSNPIHAFTARNLVHLGRHERAPRSPFSNPMSSYERSLFRGKPMRSPQLRSKGVTQVKLVRRPPTPTRLFSSPKGGNRTRRNRKRR
jgi:hypothetical protein